MNENVLFFLKFKKDIQFFYETLPMSIAVDMMKESGFTAVPVINSRGKYTGTVTEGDFLWYILENGSDPEILENTTVQDLVRARFMPAVNIDVPMEQLLDTSLRQNFVPVVDDRNIFIGIVTRQALLRHYGKPRVQPAPARDLEDFFSRPVQVMIKP